MANVEATAAEYIISKVCDLGFVVKQHTHKAGETRSNDRDNPFALHFKFEIARTDAGSFLFTFNEKLAGFRLSPASQST